MDYETPVDDYCDAYEDQSLDISGVEEADFDQFFIRMEVELIRAQEQDEEEHNEEDSDYFHLESTTSFKLFQERCDRLPCNNLPRHSVKRMLDLMEVPVHRQAMMLNHICSCADRIANEPHNRNKKILPMKVYVSVAVNYSIEESEHSFVSIPMSTEQFRIVSVNDESECVICMETMEVGSEATVVPCSHLYHKNCLVNWLRVRRVCPICCFVLPQ